MTLENTQSFGEKKILEGGGSYQMLSLENKNKSEDKIAKLIYEEEEKLNIINNGTETAKNLSKVIPLMTGAVVYKMNFDSSNRA